ncbi:MAG: tetratricopeptide repeat protein [Myxococcales bacterium]|nr:tetratricopeptide repeat protein [Myxococcales bacterium]
MRRSDSEAIEEALEDAPLEALAMVRELLSADDADADVWGYLADCQTELGDRQAALSAWAHYLTLDPHWPEAYTARAEIFADSGDLRAARAELGLATELAADDPRVLRTEALLSELTGDLNGADVLYAKGEEADPLWPAPIRYRRNKALRFLQRELEHPNVQTEEMPTSAEPGGFLRRAEFSATGALILYLRNLERDLDGDSQLEDLHDAALEALDTLQAN